MNQIAACKFLRLKTFEKAENFYVGISTVLDINLGKILALEV